MHYCSYFTVLIWFELLPQGLTEKFKEKDMSYSGSATFGYEAFMLTVLPFLIA
jgi:calcium-binding protein CML